MTDLTTDHFHRPTDLCACYPYGEDRCEYRLVADLAIDRLNPRDDDVAEVSVVMDSIRGIADFVESLPCSCPPDAAPPEYADPCARCAALGRRLDVLEER